MNPNNLDFESTDYNLLPPGDSFIPALTEPQGANYFDPNSGHLYLIVKGPSTIEIKTQPIVILKLGMTVPIENFFEANVVGNLAGLLGIDPANIRVTNIVREGSVSGRKKRAEGDVLGMDFEIGPPPATTLGGEFLPPDDSYTTPDTSGTTQNPAYTTVTIPSNTTAWVAPAGHMDYEALAAVSTSLINSFQSGTLDLSSCDGCTPIEGMETTGLNLEAPVQPPEAPPPYSSPEERNQVTDLTYAEQLALNNTAMLEELEPRTFDVPEGLAVADEPEDAAEMQVLAKAVRVYAKTGDGTMIVALGDISDPWKCTVSVQSGPGSGTVMGTTTVEFIEGIATFDDIYMGEAGDDYILQFEVSYPTTSINGTTSLPFNVASRPLGFQFTTEPPLVAQNTTFTVAASVWDAALDIAASASVLSSYSWDCTVALVNGTGTLSGTTEVTLAAGENTATFDDLMMDEPGLSNDLEVACTSSDGSTYLSAISAPFHVHDYPTTGMLRATDVQFTFKGPLQKVEGILANFNSAIGTVSCTGCPAGMAGTRRKREATEKKADLSLWSSPLH
jgi:hypothetical protein